MSDRPRTVADALRSVQSSREGLTSRDAATRMDVHDRRRATSNESDWLLLLRQFRSPLVVLLLCALVISWGVGEHLDAAIVFIVLTMSTCLGFWQERRASRALKALLALIQVRSTVVRDGVPIEVLKDNVVPGDLLILNAGDTIPGDAVLLDSKDLFVDESSLTGESYPAEKHAMDDSQMPVDEHRSSQVFDGTHVVSGYARALILKTGSDTQFGSISERLRLRAPETEFERGLRKFGVMLLEVTLVLVVAILAIHILFHPNRSPLEVFTFSLALAVGMTPELLPAIVSITLARGAQQMAKKHVIVRHLSSIENLGSMTVLCSDKTGTLTEGTLRLHAALDSAGNSSDRVLLHAVLNATFQSGFSNPIDQALASFRETIPDGYTKCDEVPYDFIRKRLSVVVAHGANQHWLITKGAFTNVLDVCDSVATDHGIQPIADKRETLGQRYIEASDQGYRVLAIAIRDVTGDPVIDKDDETGMQFLGFLLFEDPPKTGVFEAIQELRDLGIRLKVITGDNPLVAKHLGMVMGISKPSILTGPQMREMSDDALLNRVRDVEIFAETEPNQKERILIALRKSGEVVGYLGDGINDASALHVADVGISVDSAVDVAKEAADMILLKHDLGVIARGVQIGRCTFANSIKYVLITTSANFGNMFSMAGASLFLPFLPLLPKQILLNNFLSDLPSLSISTDNVDPEQIRQPRRWDQRMIQRFMLVFGLISSMFDFLTFGCLIFVLKATESQFQTSWFIESLITELTIVMIIRTRRPFHRSKPGRLLTIATLLVTVIAFLLPYTPLAGVFGLVPLPAYWIATLLAITLLYLWVNEWTKRAFFAWLDAPQKLVRT